MCCRVVILNEFYRKLYCSKSSSQLYTVLRETSLSVSVLGFPTPATEVPITVPVQHNGKQNLKQLNDVGLQAFTMMHNERNGNVQFRAWMVYLGL